MCSNPVLTFLKDETQQGKVRTPRQTDINIKKTINKAIEILSNMVQFKPGDYYSPVRAEKV